MTKSHTPRPVQAALVAAVIGAAVWLAVGGLSNSPLVSAMVHVWLTGSTTAGLKTTGDQVTGAYPDVAIETASGEQISFSQTGGSVRIATMFYTHCPGVCPLTIAALQELDRRLTTAQRRGLRVVLLSLEPARDSPAALRVFMNTHRIASDRWLLGRTSAAETDVFADFLRIHSRRLSDGSINHSSALVLLDAQGRTLARTADDGISNSEFVAAVRHALNEPGRD
jgi:protein SCO1